MVTGGNISDMVELMDKFQPNQSLIIENFDQCLYEPKFLNDDNTPNEHQAMLSRHKGRKKRKRKKKGKR